jgi:hypothetical protein
MPLKVVGETRESNSCSCFVYVLFNMLEIRVELGEETSRSPAKSPLTSVPVPLFRAFCAFAAKTQFPVP